MDWYYAKEGRPCGPISEIEFRELVSQGAITPGTQVWREGMQDWLPYGALPPESSPTVVLAGRRQCTLCKRVLPEDEVIQYQGQWVCGECKPTFLQCLREGVPLAQTWTYGGFWIRFGASFIDGIVMWVVSFVVGLVFGGLLGAVGNSLPESVMLVANMMLSLIGMAIGVTYETYFIGRWGATLGKMACGLKVVRSNGEKVTYMRAFGRYWGKMVSGLIFAIGYIMAAFDSEKRALHDYMCDTRVIRTR